MDRFDHIANFVLEELEGFWSDDKNDRGGATKYGVSLKFLGSLPDRDGDGYKDGDLDRDGDVDAADVRLVDHEGALRIYREEFWDVCRCGDLPAGIDAPVFGGAINHGPSQSVKLLQESLRIKSDGKVGPVTIGAARKSDVDRLIADYMSRRAMFYHGIVLWDSSQSSNLRGWFKRLFKMQAFALELAE